MKVKILEGNYLFTHKANHNKIVQTPKYILRAIDCVCIFILN